MSNRELGFLVSGMGLALGIPVVMILVVFARLDHHSHASNLQSLNNLKNLALAVNNSATFNGGRLPSDTREAPCRSWRLEILPYLDRAELYRDYNRNVAWDARENQEITKENLKVLDAPEGGANEKTSNGFAISDYGMISGPGTVHPDDHVVTLDEISKGDGLGQTLLLGECVGLRLAWAEPRDPRVDREIMGIDLLSRTGQTSNKLLSAYNIGGAHVAFADGYARLLSDKIDPKILKALCTVDA
ncbi:DUF1559 domain-containing protein [bacterium]|nr:DUF1559 domain-containing protein [bacterium]